MTNSVMGNIKPKVIILDSGIDHGLIEMKIAELKSANPSCEVVTIEEAMERGLMAEYKFKAPPPIPELILSSISFCNGKSKRNMRREAERAAKKRGNKFRF